MSAAATIAATGCIAGYPLEAVLGRGRHSTVYLARSPARGCRVALKVARRATQLRHEFAVMAALAHPCLLQVFDCGTAGSEAYLAMEFAEGGRFEAQHRNAAHWLSLLGQAAAALAWIHQSGWVHRDVKPANLLLRGDGSLAVGDFGCACRRGEAAGLPEGSMVGSPRYASPEQSQGAPAEPSADVYSLGVCLYEMLAGQPLYPGETVTEVVSQHLMAPIPRLPADRAVWQPLLDAMLAKDPRHRLRDGQALALELECAGRSLLGTCDSGTSRASRNTS